MHISTVGRLGKMSRLSSRAVTQLNDETQCNNNNIYPFSYLSIYLSKSILQLAIVLDTGNWMLEEV